MTDPYLSTRWARGPKMRLGGRIHTPNVALPERKWGMFFRVFRLHRSDSYGWEGEIFVYIQVITVGKAERRYYFHCWRSPDLTEGRKPGCGQDSKKIHFPMGRDKVASA